MSRPAPQRTAREVLLTSGAVIGALCILLPLGALVFGVTPLVFRSGSMSPAIETGALGLARARSRPPTCGRRHRVGVTGAGTRSPTGWSRSRGQGVTRELTLRVTPTTPDPRLHRSPRPTA